MTLPLMENILTVTDAIEADVVSKVTRRVGIYEYNAVTPWTGIDQTLSRIVDGSVSVDYDRDERRVLDLTLLNDDHLLDPETTRFWYDKVIKVFRGVETSAWRFETQIGEFVIDRIDTNNFPGHAKITGRDYTKRLMLSKLGRATNFAAGTPVELIITAVAANGGVAKVNLNTIGKSLGADASFESKTSRWELLKSICTSYSLEIFVDRYGVLTVRPFRDPVASPATIFLRTGLRSNLAGFNRSVNDSRIRNHLVAIGTNQDVINQGILIFAEARNTEPSSPTRIEKLGERTEAYESPQFTSFEQAQEFVDGWMRVAALEEFTFAYESLVYPWQEAGDIAVLDLENATGPSSDPDRLLITSFDIPLSLGTSSGTGKRVSIVGSGSSPGETSGGMA
jgi:hypothetical protein